MNDYKAYIESFVNIEDQRIRDRVEDEIANGKLWPLPLIQFNPSFTQGVGLNDLIKEGAFHAELNNVFTGFRLYQHQVEALRKGVDEKGFVVISGTGSGKSLTYIATIFDNLFKSGNTEKGVKAVIVYPMNALINSQFLEIGKYAEKYKQNTGREFPIRFKKYTGQESFDDKQDTIANPPDILLTNYVMLELLLTRNNEENLRKKVFQSLKFLVFDELHTYRGRQGSDVGLLVRKLKAQCRKKPICIGTSATMATGNTWLQQQQVISKVAKDFFAEDFSTDQIIGEYLDKVTNGQITSGSVISALKNAQDFSNENEFVNNALSIWLEDNIVLSLRGDRYFRAKPLMLPEIISKLSEYCGLEKTECTDGLINYLQALEVFNTKQAKHEKKTYFAFKLHQFINQTGSVYATLETLDQREIELDAISKTSPDRGAKPFYQIAFSRITGADLYCVVKDDIANRFAPRPFNKYIEDDDVLNAGYLLIQENNSESFWEEQRDIENLPENWIKYDKNGNPQIKKEYRNRLPESVYVNEYGIISDRPKNGYFQVWFIPYNSNIDFTSGTVYDTRTKEGTMYSSLGVEGRSTSTNVLVFSMIRQMHSAGLAQKIQKVLSFTDNRQDTALQSGHFNDFIKVGQLRSAIWRALVVNNTLDYTSILDTTYSQLRVNPDEFVLKPADYGTYQYEENIKAIKSALYYKIIYDLRRGWRVILPNLEQCGLLRINYRTLDQEVIRNKWAQHTITSQLNSDQLRELIFQLLDYFRKNNAIYLNALTNTEIDKNYRIFKENLKSSWLFSSDEKILYPYQVRVLPTTRRRNTRLYLISAGSRSAPARFIKNFLASEIGFRFSNAAEFEDFIIWLLDELTHSGFLVRNDNTIDVPLYQLNGTHILWDRGDETTVANDKVKNPSYFLLSPRINRYFQSFYKTDFAALKPIRAGEHSGQLKNDHRIKFEDNFRSGDLSLLCCSPTMELGIDISDLMAVHMRNVPPDPSNYAQRSGRAGRSGQAALVFAYCSAGSAHDQHYFQHRIDMVAGIVQAPRLDYSNEELLRGHLYSLYLAEAGIADINISLASLVNEIAGTDFLKLKSTITEKLSLNEQQIETLVRVFQNAVSDFITNEGVRDWLDEGWIRRNLDDCIQRFDKSLDRWRTLYKNALSAIQKATLIENDVTIPSTDERKRNAIREKRMALKEIDLLRNVQAQNSSNNDQSEFYPYRYLAAEGFLPGFNFTRLPVRLFVPHEDGQYISRPRSLAIREFGPRNSIYYMGNKFTASRMPVNDINSQLGRAKISLATGYILTDQNGDYDQNLDPFANIELNSDSNRELLQNLVELSECRADEQGRITCEEEERIREGFEIDTYFSMKGNLRNIKKLKATVAGEELLEISFLPAVSLYKVNSKWRTTDLEGFLIEENSGLWKKPSTLNNLAIAANPISVLNVRIFTDYTADAIYIKPLKHLNLANAETGPITLLYALKRAIENIFQVESREIGAEIMGNPEEPNIMIYEAAEGSLGILKQIIKDPNIFRRIATEAYDICHFNLSEEDQQQFGTASYHDLLSYFNQQFHQEINRYDIRDALTNLMRADYTIQHNNLFESYDQQFDYLMNQVDPSSSTEVRFLQYLYDNKLRLPDRTQFDLRPKGCNTIPDFLYETEVHASIFCDGIHHDNEEIKRMDAQKRACVENLGYEVIVWHYRKSMDELVAEYPHIFSKVST